MILRKVLGVIRNISFSMNYKQIYGHLFVIHVIADNDIGRSKSRWIW